MSLEAAVAGLMGLGEMSKKLHDLIVRKHHVSYLGELVDDVGIDARDTPDAEIARRLGPYCFSGPEGHGAGREIWDAEVEIQFDRGLQDLHRVLRRLGRYGAWEVSMGAESEVTVEPMPPRESVATHPLVGALDVDCDPLEEDGLYAGFLVPIDAILEAVGLTDTGTVGELLTYAHRFPDASADLFREVSARQAWGGGDAFRRADYEADVLRAVTSPRVDDHGGKQVFRPRVHVPEYILRSATNHLDAKILEAPFPHPELGSLYWSNALAATDEEDFDRWVDFLERIVDELYETRLRYYGRDDDFRREDVIRVMDLEGLVESWAAAVAEHLPTTALQGIDRHPAARLTFDSEWRASVSAPLSGSIRALREWAGHRDEDVVETIESAVRRYRWRLRWRGIETGYEEIASVAFTAAGAGYSGWRRETTRIRHLLEAAKVFFGLGDLPVAELRWSDRASKTRLLKALTGDRPVLSDVPPGPGLRDLSGVGYGTQCELLIALRDTMMQIDREVIEHHSEANQRAREEAADALDELEAFFDA